jgi:hypothetical protein
MANPKNGLFTGVLVGQNREDAFTLRNLFGFI